MTALAKSAAIAALATLLVAGCASSRTPKASVGELSGLASWYGQEYAGRLTANGEIFDPSALTAAHRTLPFGTIVRVTNPQNGKSVDIRINDRGPFIENRVIDLSYAAAAAIDIVTVGVTQVRVEVLKMGAGQREAPRPLVVSIPGSTRPPEPTPAASRPSGASVRSDSAAARAVADETDSTPPPTVGFPLPPSTATPPAPAEKQPVIIEHEPVDPFWPAAPAQDAPAGTPPSPAAPGGRRVAGETTWSLQLGAFGVEQNARQLQQQAMEITRGVLVVKIGGLYRVRVGPFTSKVAAIEMREKLATAGFQTYLVSE